MSGPPPPPPEILAPAGDWESLRAAAANGADAVYFGLTDFNARFRAANFTVEELPEVLRFLHARNVRGYVAFNTLVFSDELPRCAAILAAIADAGADGVIVQDLGVARLVRRLAPSLPVHGSTQMTLTEPRGIAFVRGLGVDRVILARELSLTDIEAVAAATETPLEVFVHGALCIAYSGQCLTSESLGGRSANRGQCAQACRLPYALRVDGLARDLGDKAYLLSPQDLAAVDRVDRLAALGVRGLKIEGRLKSAHYVAASTRAYRAALDAARARRPFALPPAEARDLALSFSRGLARGFLDGVDHQTLVHARYSKNRGIRAGVVAGKTDRGVIVAPEVGVGLKPGDGVVFDEGRPGWDEQGGRIYAVRPAPGAPRPGKKDDRRSSRIELLFGRGDVHLAALPEGCIVWKTDDPALRRRLAQTWARDAVARREPLSVRVRARAGEPLQVAVRDGTGREVLVSGDWPLARAEKHPITLDLVREQFGRLGGTPFALDAVESEALEPVMAPKSVLNALRRKAVEALLALRAEAPRDGNGDPGALDALRREIKARFPDEQPPPDPAAPRGSGGAGTSHLYVLVRRMDQLEAVLDWDPPAPLRRPSMVYCDFEDVRRYREAVDRSRAAGAQIGLATLRVAKQGEEGLLRQIADCDPDAFLVRNLTGVTFYREHAPRIPRIGDYSLNAANDLTAALLAEAGLARLVPSYDLTWRQMESMLGLIDPALFEVVLHQHMPMFHMEHCVYAATLSAGKDFRDCGRPCDRHRIELRDRMGADHPVGVDVGCRNTVYNAAAQSAAEFVPAMRARGLRHFRVELLRETPDETRPLLECYARVLAGVEDGRAAWRRLKAVSQLGVTRGTFAV